ncbi:MAG: hypothetical protein NT137_00080 [Methanomassiliicoccales archaeon]|nr:hypothetical protein [Methanomassiliicoccales archaeon]
MATERIELRPPMAEWLKDYADTMGVTLQELVTHILLRYREEFESSDELEDESEDDEDSE